jgi:3-hydroxyisobutyrate dehydrogenase
METRPRVGVIGLGVIGSAFARDLAERGFTVTGFDTDSAKIRDAVPADSCLAVTESSEVVLVAVPGSEALAEVMEEILPALEPRHVVVDCGTTRPETDEGYAAVLRERGASFHDAPLTLRDGRTFIVGGELSPAARVVLEALGTVLEVGPVGAGQRTKLVNQLLVFGSVAVYAEAVELARCAGVDFDALRALGWEISERLLADDLPGPDQMPLIRKDTGYVLELASAYGLQAPVAKLLAKIFRAAGPGQLHSVTGYWRSGNGERPV